VTVFKFLPFAVMQRITWVRQRQLILVNFDGMWNNL